MTASKPLRVLSLVIIVLVVVVGVRGILGSGFAGALLERGGGSATAADGEQTAGVVGYVLDGDTVEVTTRAGENVRVRLLGISAPEIPHPSEAGECYGNSSSAHLEQLLPVGSHVTLERDATQDDVDVYGRWLRYVEAAGRDIGREQIRAGAAAARDSSDPVSRYGAYARGEARARQRGAGMWAACRRPPVPCVTRVHPPRMTRQLTRPDGSQGRPVSKWPDDKHGSWAATALLDGLTRARPRK